MKAEQGSVKLVAENLVLARGGRTIAENLSFAVAAGEALVLTGPNGIGKTTLIRTIAGFLSPISGTLALEGGGADRTLAEDCHYIGHLNGMKSSLTVVENLRFWAAFLSEGGGREPRLDDAVGKAIAAFELDALSDIPAGYLSAGQKRRLGLARLLVVDRPVWLLDEPTVSLDARSTGLLAAEIERHMSGGGIAIAATHLDLGLAHRTELRLDRRQEAA